MKILFCFPVHNEAKILENSIIAFLEFMKKNDIEHSWRILIAVNNSSDETFFLANKLQSLFPDKITVSYTEKRGKGNAIKTSFHQADDDLLVYMDVDLAVSLENIPDLVNSILNIDCDLAFGSRLLPTSNTSRSITRSLSSRAYNLLSRIILHHDFSDLQCGFKAIKKTVFKKVESFILDDEWFFDTELVCFAWQQKLRIREFPVNWEENRYDQRKSKIRLFHDSQIFLRKLFELKKRLPNSTKYLPR